MKIKFFIFLLIISSLIFYFSTKQTSNNKTSSNNINEVSVQTQAENKKNPELSLQIADYSDIVNSTEKSTKLQSQEEPKTKDKKLTMEDTIDGFTNWQKNENYVWFDELQSYEDYLKNDLIDSAWSKKTEESINNIIFNDSFKKFFPNTQITEVNCRTKLCKVTFKNLESNKVHLSSFFLNLEDSEPYRHIVLEAVDDSETQKSIYVIRGEH